MDDALVTRPSVLASGPGRSISIPGGGPYYVSVRAANGTAYATLPSPVKVGIVLDLWGEGQSAAIISGARRRLGQFDLHGPLRHQLSGGDILFLRHRARAGDARLSRTDPDARLRSLLHHRQWRRGHCRKAPRASCKTCRTRWAILPRLSQWVRDGAGLNVFVWGNQVQAQSIGIADGTKTTWCSASNFCANVGQGGTLNFNLASMTGAGITASISGTTLTVGTINMGALNPAWFCPGRGSPAHHCLSPARRTVRPRTSIGAPGRSGRSASAKERSAARAMRADPVGGAPTPYYNPAAFGLARRPLMAMRWSRPGRSPSASTDRSSAPTRTPPSTTSWAELRRRGHRVELRQLRDRRLSDDILDRRPRAAPSSRRRGRRSSPPDGSEPRQRLQ